MFPDLNKDWKVIDLSSSDEDDDGGRNDDEDGGENDDEDD
jgi:hypothetical protein